jgi:carbon starvation protein
VIQELAGTLTASKQAVQAKARKSGAELGVDTGPKTDRYIANVILGLRAIVLRCIRPLTNRYAATALAVVLGGTLAMMPAKAGAPYGTGGLILWPLFGATNQLLAGLAFMVTLFYLWRRQRPIWFIIGPTIIMLILPAVGLFMQMFHPQFGWWTKSRFDLLGIGAVVLCVQVWIVLEGVRIWRAARGVLEESLPPLAASAAAKAPLEEALASGGRSC